MKSLGGRLVCRDKNWDDDGEVQQNCYGARGVVVEDEESDVANVVLTLGEHLDIGLDFGLLGFSPLSFCLGRNELTNGICSS